MSRLNKEFNTPKSIIKKEVKNWDSSFKYSMLSRMKSDCDYYLGYGGRAKENLWAGNEIDQINYMQEVYSQLKKKPQWLSKGDLRKYKCEILSNYKIREKIPSLAYYKKKGRN